MYASAAQSIILILVNFMISYGCVRKLFLIKIFLRKHFFLQGVTRQETEGSKAREIVRGHGLAKITEVLFV